VHSILLYQFLVRLSLIIMINGYKVIIQLFKAWRTISTGKSPSSVKKRINKTALFVFSVSVRPVLSRLAALYQPQRTYSGIAKSA